MVRDTTPPGSIAERVDGLIGASGLSRHEFAHRAGLDPAKLTDALHGHRRFSSLDLAKIGDLTQTDVLWLITGRRLSWWRRLWETATRLGWRVRRLWWRMTDCGTRS